MVGFRKTLAITVLGIVILGSPLPAWTLDPVESANFPSGDGWELVRSYLIDIYSKIQDIYNRLTNEPLAKIIRITGRHKATARPWES